MKHNALLTEIKEQKNENDAIKYKRTFFNS